MISPAFFCAHEIFMSKLSIVLSGVVEESNFDEWKTELTEQIRSVKTDLKTDDDFDAATEHVKQFKAAELTPVEAKRSAIEQATEINTLFQAIDSVSEEARQARLTLDKQIKRRKKEIKNDFIASGVESIKAFIAEQSEAFRTLSHSAFVEEKVFTSALSGKASSDGMQKAIAKTCEAIKAAITEQATGVKENSARLDSLSSDHQILFPDRVQLIAMSTEQLDKTIKDRVNRFNSQSNTSGEPTTETIEAPEIRVTGDDSASSTGKTTTGGSAKTASTESDADKSDYKVTIDINASKEEAEAIRKLVAKALSSNSAVGAIALLTN